MNVPGRDYLVVGRFTCRAQPVPAGVWQDHLVRHPLGLHGKPAPWDLEGWDQTAPPVITARRRKDLLAKIGELADNGARCLVPEIAGRPRGVVEPEVPWCSSCAAPVRDACVALCHTGDPVGTRYAEQTEQCLAAVAGEDGEIVTRTALVRALLRTRNAPTEDGSLVVLSFGDADGADRRIARLNRGDGTRVEFYVDLSQAELRWRTTYRLGGNRNDARTPLLAPRRQFITQFATPSARFGALSDKCIVPRLWWRDHAS